MPISPIKQARLLAGFTQAEVAQEMHVSQPTYQRWEVGDTPVPKNKISNLATLLDTTEDVLKGISKPFDFLGYDPDTPEDLQYFGEVSIHFVSGNTPLLLPITRQMANILMSVDCWSTGSYFLVSSLDNRLVICPSKAIADIFINADNADEFGPEEYDVGEYLGAHPDERFWKAVEFADNIASDEDWRAELVAELGEEVVASAIEVAVFSEKIIEAIAEEEKLSPESILELRKEREKLAECFRSRAQDVVWQLSKGKLRNLYVEEDFILHSALSDFVESPDDFEGYINLTAEEFCVNAFINPHAIDFLSIPEHRYKNGNLQNLEDLIDNSEEPTPPPPLLLSSKRRSVG